MTAEQKIINVEAQVRAMLRSETNCLNCPYCGKQNFPPKEHAPSVIADDGDYALAVPVIEDAKPLCCADLAQTVNAVSDKLQSDELLDAADRIAQKASKQVILN